MNTKKENENITVNIYRLQACYCIGIINFMFLSKSLTGFTDLFSPNNLKHNDKIILNIFLI